MSTESLLLGLACGPLDGTIVTAMLGASSDFNPCIEMEVSSKLEMATSEEELPAAASHLLS